MSVPGNTKGSGTSVSDPGISRAAHLSVDRWDRFVAWCDRHGLDPDDDTNLEEYDTDLALARQTAAEDRLTNEELWA